jgi:sodium-independent sulfate anion transporter 11
MSSSCGVPSQTRTFTKTRAIMSLRNIGPFFAKVLFIDPNYRSEPTDITGSGADLQLSTGTFVEDEPTAGEWIRKTLPSEGTFVKYIKSLFPFAEWILHYNVTWLMGDIIAGEYYHSCFGV